MATEERRGCGFRKVGGMYLVGEGQGFPCDRLPVSIHVCPTCGGGVKFSRGVTWIDPVKLFGEHLRSGVPCGDPAQDPVCHPVAKAILMWVGGRFYTPENFVEEAARMGVSKRIHTIPRGLKLGETWVLLAHQKVVDDVNEKGQSVKRPGIFYAFRPQRVELILKESDATPERIAKEEKRGVTVVKVPDSDGDHKGTVYDNPAGEQTTLDAPGSPPATVPPPPEEEIEARVARIVEALETKAHGAPWDKIIKRAVAEGITQEDTEEALNSLVDKAVLFEPVLGQIRKVA